MVGMHEVSVLIINDASNRQINPNNQLYTLKILKSVQIINMRKELGTCKMYCSWIKIY